MVKKVQLKQIPASSSSGVLTQVTAAGGAVCAALEPVHDVLQVSAVAAALTPHKQSFDHMVAHCAHAGTLVAPAGEEAQMVKVCCGGGGGNRGRGHEGQVAPVADPALVAHWPLAVAAVDVQRGGRLVQTGDGAARTQLDDLVGHVPQLEPLQQVDVGHVPVFLKHGHAVTATLRISKLAKEKNDTQIKKCV